LGDVDEADGGFVYVPGSHKARYPVPEGIELCTDDMGMVRHLSARAGDVVLFMGAAQTHGALPWTGAVKRRVALLNYRSANRP
jgi:ectoine hydroxylase-related dioxygenase (phytanoyl-CoA dioxygenase family)